jgi:hypothetical protein
VIGALVLVLAGGIAWLAATGKLSELLTGG